MKRIILSGLCLLLTSTAMAANSVEAWRAPNGATLWRVRDAGVVRWELADVDGDGRVDIAIFHCGEKYTRVEIDTKQSGKADRVYLFNPDGTSVGYLSERGDGVLAQPAGPRDARERALHEVGRGGEIFRKALELRYRADAGQLQAVDAPAPPAWPPFARPAGAALTFNLRLTLLPAGEAVMLQRTEKPADITSLELTARPGVGRSFEEAAVRVRPDPGNERTVPGKLTVDLYPVWTTEPTAEGGANDVLVMQLTGRLNAPNAYDELFFFTTPLTGDRPATLNVPIHDRAGRPTAQLLVEIRREEAAR